MFDLLPKAIAISLDREQRELVLSGVFDFDEADALPKGLYAFTQWREAETGETCISWEITDLGRAVRAILRKKS